jgi:DNA-binding CsgD family transcriptional regulator
MKFSLRRLKSEPGLFRLVMGAVVSFALYGFIYSLASMYFSYDQSPGNVYGVVGFASAGVVLLVILSISRKRLPLSHLYWVLQPVFVAGLLLHTVQSFWGEALISLGYVLLLLLCTLTICEMARRFETPVFYLAAFVFGVGIAFCCFGLIAGYLCALLLPYPTEGFTYVIWLLIIGLTMYTAVSSRSGGFTFNISLNTAQDRGEAAMEGTPDPHDMEISKTVYYEAIEQRCVMLGERFRLTARETEILSLLARNQGTAEIAEELTLAPSTVKVHIHNVFGKLGIHRRTDLLAFIHDDR